MSKFSENPSIKKLNEDINGMQLLLRLATPFGWMNKKMRHSITESKERLHLMKTQLEELLSIADEFNESFSNDGWIAYEHMSLDVMKETVVLHKSGQTEQAKQTLLNYYAPSAIKVRKFMLNNIEPFRIRFSLIDSALKNYSDKQYLACIPQLLMLMDGIVNDVNKKGGFAANNTQMEVWDSISGHNSGLNKIKEIITRSRKKTTTEPIFLPYRNGILHGRDLNYGNQELAAKCWGILFAISDWATAFYSEEQRKIEFKEEIDLQQVPLRESLRQLAEQKEKNEQVRKAIEAWIPRKILIGDTTPETGNAECYGYGTPERAVVEFLGLINKCNYGFMLKLMRSGYLGLGEGDTSQISDIRNDFSKLKIDSFRIVDIKDCAPASSEVIIEVKVLQHGNSFTRICDFKLHYENDGETAVFGYLPGVWKIVLGYSDLLYDRKHNLKSEARQKRTKVE